MAQAPLRITRRGDPIKLKIVRPDLYKKTLMTFCSGLHPRLGSESPLQLVGTDVARWIVDLMPREAFYLIGIRHHGGLGDYEEYYWTNNLSQLIKEFALERYAELTEQQKDDFYYKQAHNLWLVCTTPARPPPSETTHLAWYHYARKAGIDVYQLSFDPTQIPVWVNVDKFEVSNRSQGPRWFQAEPYRGRS